jgi:hypothetical protein
VGNWGERIGFVSGEGCVHHDGSAMYGRAYMVKQEVLENRVPHSFLRAHL